MNASTLERNTVWRKGQWHVASSIESGLPWWTSPPPIVAPLLCVDHANPLCTRRRALVKPVIFRAAGEIAAADQQGVFEPISAEMKRFASSLAYLRARTCVSNTFTSLA